MFNTIDWTQFLTFLGITLGLYYVVLLVLAGKGRPKATNTATTGAVPANMPRRVWQIAEQEPGGAALPPPALLTNRLTGPSTQHFDAIPADDTEPAPQTVLTDDGPSPIEAQFDALEALVSTLDTQLNSLPPNTSIDEVLLHVRKEVAAYPTLDAPPFRDTFNDWLAQQIYQQFKYTLTPDEINRVWNP